MPTFNQLVRKGREVSVRKSTALLCRRPTTLWTSPTATPTARKSAVCALLFVP